ncbi:tRNA (adenine(58)-N(1))-methyltransferase non-catalytic subunit TRM6 [Macrobrachium rosenbergii]|uniref:tRNA (adenine(58)-N(1))-methyltransferase non-catalytic subunit TRM6 n=1 Tax=Macrobrachium rosenbergii TaxID=79674 RepID=UPI0034D75BC3
MPLSSKIQEDLNVIVERSTYLKSCRIRAGRTYTFGKRGEGQFTLNLDGAVGCPYGSSFRMERVSNKLYNVKIIEDNVGSLNIVKSGGEDNRDLCDDGRSQKLTPEEIIQLKSSGLSGKQVVQTITENSATFKEKTVYSQEKYINKKHKKYAEVITIHKPSIRLLSRMYYHQDPLKISNLRVDTLSQLLCYANIQPGGNFAVFESGTAGLVSAAMLHRMGTSGHLVHVYHGNHPQREAVDLMNFTVPELEVMSFINFTKVPDIEEFTSVENGSEIHQDNKEESLSREEHCTKEVGENEINNEASDKDAQLGKPKIFVRKQIEDVQVSLSVLQEGIEGLVVACRQHPVNVTTQLLKFLKPGNPFAIFSPYKEPLMELYFEVKSQNCTNLRLSETWLRHYQVLPQRTHPEVNMSGGGGYLLYGTRISKE